jgi:hypothetical protein
MRSAGTLRTYCGREFHGGYYFHFWLWRGIGIKIKPVSAALFSDRYVWRKLRIGRYYVVFCGLFPKKADKA